MCKSCPFTSLYHILIYLFSVPDHLLTGALTQRLGRLDAVKRGWVLHGFPNTRNQLDCLTEKGKCLQDPSSLGGVNWFSRFWRCKNQINSEKNVFPLIPYVPM